MNYLDTLYRALVDYRKNTTANNECKTHRKAIIAANPAEDVIEVTRKNCTIEEDWIEAIEKGLVFIEKAIKEERQFIRSNGEVIPIEKVKRVSKDSVEHLARHSNYFTREPEEGQDLIPDNLYTVERLSDYAVYENRFLYMLLCYLRDFIGMRYEKIVELTNTYNGKMSMSKQFSESTRRVKYEVRLEEEKKNDEYLREHNKAQHEIDRILTIYKAVVVYLNTPLMIEVAKSPMVKPPIMRTNVLKMNRNFKEALSLYEFITAYDKDGYVITTEVRTVSPFNGSVGEEMAEVVDLALFLTYEHGLGIKDYLKENYETEEYKRRDEERKKLAEQVKSLSRHLKTSGVTPEEYILMLEKRIRDMEKEEEELDAAKKKIDELHEEIHKLHEELDDTHASIRSLGNEIARLNKKYADDMAAIDIERNERLRAVQDEYEGRIRELQEQYDAHVRELGEKHESEIASIRDSITMLREAKRSAEEESIKKQAEIRAEHAEKLRELSVEYQTKEDAMNAKVAEHLSKLNAAQVRYEELREQKAFADARLTAIRAQYGLIGETEDFTSKERMDELEKQYEAFHNFMKKEWNKTKKKIRRDVFIKLFEKRPKGEAGKSIYDEPTPPTQPLQQPAQPTAQPSAGQEIDKDDKEV